MHSILTSNNDNGKETPPERRPRIKPKLKYRNSDGSYSGYSGTAEGLLTIERKRARLARNQGQSGHNKAKGKQ